MTATRALSQMGQSSTAGSHEASSLKQVMPQMCMAAGPTCSERSFFLFLRACVCWRSARDACFRTYTQNMNTHARCCSHTGSYRRNGCTSLAEKRYLGKVNSVGFRSILLTPLDSERHGSARARVIEKCSNACMQQRLNRTHMLLAKLLSSPMLPVWPA